MLKEILSKRPWRRIMPNGYAGDEGMSMAELTSDEYAQFKNVSQYDFLRELHPSGHLIHSLVYYPNIIRVAEIESGSLDDDGNPIYIKRYYEEKVPRIAFAFQRLIALKQTIHDCGNDVQFDATNANADDNTLHSISNFRNGWLDKGMEIAFYMLVRSVKRTGDGAVVGYISNGKFDWISLSFENGDRLYPHYDRSGRLEIFARAFNNFDDECITRRYVEVWDDTHYYLLRDKNRKAATPATDTAETSDEYSFNGKYTIHGYELLSMEPHGFNGIVPVAYYRDENGPAWTDAQDLIDDYELAFSQMAQNNKAFGEPILVFKGDNISTLPDSMTGTIKTIDMDADSEVSYLEAQSAAESFMKQLETLYLRIFETTSTVIPPKDLKSGDLPAAALKILYSPAYEQAFEDTNLYDAPLGHLVEIFKRGYGIETHSLTDFLSMPLKYWLKPYVHVNWSAVITDLVAAVGSGFLSKQTASERASEYATPDEWTRIMTEETDKLERDLEQAIKLKKATAVDKTTSQTQNQ